ncbi:nuclear transport factor 2 family protein [Psychroserpens burtonensis]|uniref:nuclear transport factor 2 family protein n=1 Tax=Psychroserpens burtonensis TaxID=49278 RepID=UPI0004181BEC|nr:nuclear transport factor 2 family protein [Psychroserpens burtonensis]
MKQYFSLLFILSYSLSFAQPNTEVFLYDIETSTSKIELKNGKNLSNNEGYDNQPSFLDDRYIVFASTRNNQTDIAKYDIRYDSKSWLNFSEGGEYTPLKIPKKNEISAVRLDTDGKQRLYTYNMSNGSSTELIQDLVVAYYTWFDETTVISAVIEDDNLNLYVNNLQDNTSRKYVTNVGRSFHRIPNSNLISFIAKEDEKKWQIKSLNPKTGATTIIANTMTDVEDICWLNDKTMLCGKDSVLYKLTLKKDNDWKQVADLSSEGITKITRLATNTESNKLLVTADLSILSDPTETQQGSIVNQTTESEESTTESTIEASQVEAIIQRNLDAYNARNIDAFMKDYTDDVKLYEYPSTLQTEGKDAMRKNYKDWFDRTTDLRAFVKKRIVIGNKVIDEEQVTANGKIFNAVAIYEIENGKITKVTFIQ